MAFFGIFVLNILFCILLLVFFAGIVLLIASIGFALFYRSKKRKSCNCSGKWQKRASVICGILALIIFVFFGGAFFLLSLSGEVSVETKAGAVKLSKSTAVDFERAIEADDVEKVSSMLAQNPELSSYIDGEGYHPLGAAIRHDALATAAYLLENGFDVNGGKEQEEEPSIALVCRMSLETELNVDMLNLLLDYHPDVNSTANAMPPVQYVIKHMCRDKAISRDELRLLERFLDEGADLTAVNGTGKNAVDYFKSLADKMDISDAREDEVLKLLK